MSQDGYRQFRIMWIGQFVSLLGSGLGWFAVTVWAWRTSGSATQFALLTFCSFATGLLLSPLAGALADRLSRKALMLLCDTGLALCSTALLGLYASGQLQVWHLMVLAVLEGALESFHWLAYSALVSDLVPDDRRSRANGLVALGDPASEVLAPAAGGVLLAVFSLGGVILVDLATYLVGVCALLMTQVPDHRAGADPKHAPAAPRTLRSDLLFGFRYIWRSAPLRALTGLFLVMNLVGGVAYALNLPLVLLRGDDSSVLLGTVVAAGGTGGVLGALLMSVWQGPRARARFVALGMAVGCALGPMLMAVAHTAVLLAAAAFLAAFVPPVINTSYQTLWQGEVPSEQQGRVFGARRVLTQITLPVGLLGSGPLVDSALGDAIGEGTAAADMLGAGKEGAAALAIGMVAVVGVIAACAGALAPSLRRLDHASAARSAAEPLTHAP